VAEKAVTAEWLPAALRVWMWGAEFIEEINSEAEPTILCRDILPTASPTKCPSLSFFKSLTWRPGKEDTSDYYKHNKDDEAANSISFTKVATNLVPKLVKILCIVLIP
jgi:hypothetical protein